MRISFRLVSWYYRKGPILDMTTEPADLLCYLPDFKVIVCTSCHYALQPQAISRHLKDIHHILRSSRRPFLQYISTFDLDDAETVIRTSDSLKDFPVPFLPVVDGLRCSHHGCAHLCVTEKRMKSHWSLIHHHAGRCEPTWEAVLLQTFFRGNSLRYFTGPSGLARVRDSLSGKGGAVIQDSEGLLKHFVNSTSTTLANGVGMLDDVDRIVSMSSSDLFQHNLIHHSRVVPALTTMHIRTKTLSIPLPQRHCTHRL